MRQQSQIGYRMAAADGATQIGLIMVVYDAIAADLHKAGHAAQAGDIAGRCAASSHALLLVGHLESWLDSLDDSRLRASLVDFYGMLRQTIVVLQREARASGFEALAQLVCDTRAVWQSKEQTLQQELGRRAATQSPRYPVEAEHSARSVWCA